MCECSIDIIRSGNDYWLNINKLIGGGTIVTISRDVAEKISKDCNVEIEESPF